MLAPQVNVSGLVGRGVRSSLLDWFAVVSVMMGIFVIVTAEILPIGLLTPVAHTFGITEGIAGLMMTLPGIIAAIAAPLVTVTTARVDRRVMLCVLIMVLAISNAVCAMASSYWVVLAARVLVGLVIGGFWSIGAGLAGRLVAAHRVARAAAVIFAAVPLGSVFGVPIGTLIGEVAGWRVAFWSLAGLTVAVLLALARTLPRLPPQQVTRLGVLGKLVRHRNVQIGLVGIFLIVLAHFGTYTYVTTFLRQVTGLDLGVISILLLIYGVAGVLGNFIAGAAIRRHLRATFGVAASMIATATLLLPFVGQSISGVVFLLGVWGLGYGGVPVCCQAWIARSSDSPEAATVLFTSSFQATIAIGALAGGMILDISSVTLVMLCGGAVAVVMALLVSGLGRPPESSA